MSVLQSQTDQTQELKRRVRIPTALLLIGFSGFYFADVLIRASEKYFWYDELFTVYLCRLPVRSLWKALQAGIDANPPLFYLLTKMSNAVFGQGLIGTRMPAIVGFWIFCLCLFWFVNERVGPIAGFSAMVLPVFTGAYYYAYEARGEAIVLGFYGLALICWQMSLKEPTRKRWLLGFALILFAAFMTHCYAILIVVPFGIAEIVRSFPDRRLDWRRWASLIAPAVPACLVYIPLLQGYRSVVKGTVFSSLVVPPAWPWPLVHTFYVFLLAPSMLIVLLIIIMLAFRIIDMVHTDRSSRLTELPIPLSDLMLTVSFIALPVFGLILAKVTQAPFVNRYFLAAVAGVCILTGLGAGLGRPTNWVAITLAAILAWSAVGQFSRLLWHRFHGWAEVLDEPSSGFFTNSSLAGPLDRYSLLLSAARGGQRIVVFWPIEFLYLVNYAPALRKQLYYLKWSDADSFYRELERFHAFSPFQYNTMPAQDFLRSTPRFLLFGTNSATEMAAAVRAGATIRSLQVSDGHVLAQAEMKGTQQ